MGPGDVKLRNPLGLGLRDGEGWGFTGPMAPESLSSLLAPGRQVKLLADARWPPGRRRGAPGVRRLGLGEGGKIFPMAATTVEAFDRRRILYAATQM